MFSQKNTSNKTTIISVVVFLALGAIFFIGPIVTDRINVGKYDAEFKKYISDNYGITVNNDGYVRRCFSNCDYYGYYNVGTDYNYSIQIEKTGDKIEASVDKDVIEKRKKLYNYISSLRGNDLAPNYLGYYANTMSGNVSFSSGERSELYYIIKYRAGMNIEEEIRKDYSILKKAQEIGDGKVIIKSMRVYYVDDDRLNDSDWIKKTGLTINNYGDVVGVREDILKDIKYEYSISNYSSDENAASLADKPLEEFVLMVNSVLKAN